MFSNSNSSADSMAEPLLSTQERSDGVEEKKPGFLQSLMGPKRDSKSGPNAGSSRHDPDQRPIAHNERIPSLEKGKLNIFKQLFRPNKAPKAKESQSRAAIQRELYLAPNHADALRFIHPSIPYTLTYRHLEWVRIAESDIEQMERASSLNRRGTGINRPDLGYWIIPCWYKDSFLLEYVVQFSLQFQKHGPASRREFHGMGWPMDKKWTFTTCPHITHRFIHYRFKEKRGLLTADVSYQTSGLSQVAGTYSTDWKSTSGPHSMDWNCRYCCMDSSVQISMAGDKITVSLYVFKDLGKAQGPFDKRWIAAIRPNYQMRRTADTARSCRTRAKVLTAMDHRDMVARTLEHMDDRANSLA
ncbi:hypothetical protein AAE478_009372 [Parahypoxylon ruwenzoriense]